MRGFMRVAALFIPMLFLAVWVSTERVYAGEAEVVFSCEDIGVEARRILADLKEARERIREREKALAAHENELKILEREVDEKLERMKTLRKDLSKLLTEKEAVEAEKVKKLSKIYQKRDPAGAAASLAAMDRELAVAILAGMRDKYAGEILDNMERSKAVDYSTALGRLEL
jgi:flagellar motility protein MotE (MotC chaperone)